MAISWHGHFTGVFEVVYADLDLAYLQLLSDLRWKKRHGTIVFITHSQEHVWVIVTEPRLH